MAKRSSPNLVPVAVETRPRLAMYSWRRNQILQPLPIFVRYDWLWSLRAHLTYCTPNNADKLVAPSIPLLAIHPAISEYSVIFFANRRIKLAPMLHACGVRCSLQAPPQTMLRAA